VKGQIFNVVQDNYQIRDLATAVADAVGKLRGAVAVDHAPEPPLVRNYRCANDKLFQTLGMRPTRSVQEAVNEMVAAFGNNDPQTFGHPRFYNLDWMLLLNEVHAGLQPFDYVLRRDEPTRQGD
jgi:hypothetical protein